MYFPGNPYLSKLFKLDLPLDNLEKFVNDVEEFFSDKFLKAAIERDKEEVEEEEEEEEEAMNYYDDDNRDGEDKIGTSWLFFTKDYYLYATEFPNILRTSIFVSCFSFYENQLIRFCKLLHKRRNLALPITDLKGNGIEKAQIYLKKVAGINFPDQSKEWEFLRKCNHIRNCIVHNGGVLDEASNAKELIKAIETTDFISIQYEPFEYKIQLEKAFCIEVIKQMRRFWEKLAPNGDAFDY